MSDVRTKWKMDDTLGKKLAPRELQVLRLNLTGKSRKEIANEVNCAYKTVTNHLEHAFKKLGAHGIEDAYRKAIAAGFVDCPCGNITSPPHHA